MLAAALIFALLLFSVSTILPGTPGNRARGLALIGPLVLILVGLGRTAIMFWKTRKLD
jgi:hypothetical protein